MCSDPLTRSLAQTSRLALLGSLAVLLLAYSLHPSMLPLLRPLTHSVRPILLSSTNKITTRAFNNITFSRMRVIPVPVRSDNYAYLLVDPSTNTAAAVDPYDVKKVVAAAEKEKVKLGEWLITTHHHADRSSSPSAFSFRGLT